MLRKFVPRSLLPQPNSRRLSTVFNFFRFLSPNRTGVDKGDRHNARVTALFRDNIERLGGRPQVQLLASFVTRQPDAAITEIEALWARGVLPVSDEVVKEYMRACYLSGADTSIIPILSAYRRANDPSSNSKLIQDLEKLAASREVGAANRYFGMPISKSSTAAPLHFNIKDDTTWRSLTWDVLKNALFWGLIAALIIAAQEEMSKTSGGKGGGGMGAITKLLGPQTPVHKAEKSDKRFSDVVGVDEAKADLEEIVMYLKEPHKFTRLGAKLPKGVLLTGPPGTGKTLLAKAIAGEAGVAFFYASGSEFDEMFVGVGAKRVRELFDSARKAGTAIIFIDEIDAVGGSRHKKEHSANKMTINQLLTEMDGFEETSNLIVIGATNFPDALDSALVRPGRFDKQVVVPLPDIGGRLQILSLYLKRSVTAPDVNVEQLARGTPGFSGADLSNLVNQAALRASILGQHAITMGNLEWAKDKILMGAERKSAKLSDESRRCTAYHEAGHALVAYLTEGANPIHKATIMPRGNSLGMVMQLPDGDQTSQSRKQMLATLDILMGGRVAEELIFGLDDTTSGAVSDIEQASKLATNMVTRFGFSDKVGVMYVEEDKRKISAETQKFIDAEVQAMLTESYMRAKALLAGNLAKLDLIAAGLLEFETLSGIEIANILRGVQPDAKGVRSSEPSRPYKEIPLRKLKVGQTAAVRAESDKK